MASIISEIKLINFKRFRTYTVIPNERMNILAGDNEVGKSTVLEAINMDSSGNIKRIESMGIDRLFNIEAVREFNLGKRTFENLPNMIIELYLKGDFDFTMNGKNNSDYATNDFVKRMYLQYTESDVKERATHKSKYRQINLRH